LRKSNKKTPANSLLDVSYKRQFLAVAYERRLAQFASVVPASAGPYAPRGLRGKKQASILAYRPRSFKNAIFGAFPEIFQWRSPKINELQQRPCAGFSPDFHNLLFMLDSR
jgi:hypothetical protein